MTDIVKKLRSSIDEKEDYFISQWPGEEPKTHDAVRFQAANDIERLRAALRSVMDDLERLEKNHWLPVGMLDDVIYVNARAALEGPQDRMAKPLEGK